MLKSIREKYIGSKEFYRGVFAVALPILVQNIITNLVNMLDNIMVGQVGTEPMSGVAIVNQLIFVFNLGVFGYTSGMGILTTQYFGRKNHKGVAHTFLMKFAFGAVFLVLTFMVFRFWGDSLIWSYLHEGKAGLDLQNTFEYGKTYLNTILWGLPFFVITNVYTTTLRDIRETKVPMIAGLVAVFINLVFNYLLIYGKLGFPQLGIVGAALATNLSRVIESLICIIWTHTHSDRVEFAKDVFRDLKIPPLVVKKLLMLSIPAFINEILWSFGQTMINQCMSLRGIEIVSALNINSTVAVLCKSYLFAIGVALAILVGNALGSGDAEKAVDIDRKMIALSLVGSAFIGLIIYIFAAAVPNLYNTETAVKEMATTFIRISALYMPVEAVVNAEYHTIKSGGRPLITFCCDGGFVWIVIVPLAYILAHFTDVSIIPMYAIIFGSNIAKMIVESILVEKKIWVRTLVK